MRNFTGWAMLLAVLLLPLEVFAKPAVSVSMTAEKEVVVVSNGEMETKRVADTQVDPGEVIFYTMHFVNSGDEAATNALFVDPVPQGTVYLAESAFGNDAEITFSIDGGKTFKAPAQLIAKRTNNKSEKRIATAGEYTHIRWQVSTIPPNGSGQVGFQARVK